MVRRPFGPSNTPHFTVTEKYSRKRQRRQAAAVVVQSLWTNNSNAAGAPPPTNAGGKKSTAKPRPEIVVPPRGIGPIVDPNINDVLCGRGGRINSHAGNIQFREMVQSRKKIYLAKSTEKLEKAHIAARIVREIRSMDPPGRFLKEDRDTGLWFDIGDQKAIKKSGQALREDAPEIRGDDDSSGDEKTKATGKKAGAKGAASPTSKARGKAKSARTSPKQTASKPAVAPVMPTTVASVPITVAAAASHGMPASGHNNHIPAAGNVHGNAQLSAEEHAAQLAMPPPFSHHHAQQSGYHQHNQQQMGQQPVRTIPIQAPSMQPVYSLPNQLYGSNSNMASGGRSVSKASRHAMETLAEHQATAQHGSNQPPTVDIAFDKNFFPPPRPSSAMSGDHTMSSISGMSEQISSAFFGSGLGANSLSGQSRMSGADPHRFHHAYRPRNAEMAQPNRSDLVGSIRSMGSLTRSLSFPDAASIASDHDSYKAILDSGDDFASGIMSVSSHKYSVGSRGSMYGANSIGWTQHSLSARQNGHSHPPANGNISSRSDRSFGIDNMSIGSVSSAQWAAALGARGGGGGGSLTMDDGKSMVSDMSSDFHALDLAGTFR
eukprot:CAMPEP_0119550948 /NCGR_PEP_ID=MMETSP1352-20130426/4365_1 /TAXON_ID=265584 /ORGANISM="Stauroneis constricta, Strain CCMP1120" /LENGTH=603 /DNA_ID=CAMNT_0007596941 /DNA_START=149 /DNA_END=1960 /DNA_ORIENTATION=+